jgi:hypothetical protein
MGEELSKKLRTVEWDDSDECGDDDDDDDDDEDEEEDTEEDEDEDDGDELERNKARVGKDEVLSKELRTFAGLDSHSDEDADEGSESLSGLGGQR